MLPILSNYDEDYTNGPTITSKILKKGSYYLFKSGSHKNDLDNALPKFYFPAKLEADKAKDIYFQKC